MTNKKNKRGVLVGVEGISGAGKTSLCNAMKQRYEVLNEQVLLLGGFEVHPYSSPITALCRDLVTTTRFVGLPWLAEVHLLLAEMLHDIESLMIPSMEKGEIVLVDGYLDSFLAYEGARIVRHRPEKSTLMRDYLRQVVNMVCSIGRIPVCDCVVYIECKVDTSKARLERRDSLAMSGEDLALQMEIGRQYDALFAGRSILRIQNDDECSLEDNARVSAEYVDSFRC
ncbi:MAG TPA: hypothetical protein VLH56_09850 [Dissulfurispiraceae bacterium]|nr:hypothetical protein [Dissulfurispiraceae bacterium]